MASVTIAKLQNLWQQIKLLLTYFCKPRKTTFSTLQGPKAKLMSEKFFKIDQVLWRET